MTPTPPTDCAHRPQRYAVPASLRPGQHFRVLAFAGDCTLSALAQRHRLTRVLDHLIVAGGDVVSLAERGAL